MAYRLRLPLILLLVVALCGGALYSFRSPVANAATSTTTAAPTTALVLYDTTGQWGYLGELYGTYVSNLVGHFGTYKAESVESYQAGDINKYTATFYIGSTYGEPLPAAFLADVPTATKPVVWMYDNIWDLTAADPNFQAQYGWMWSGFDFSTVSSVNYKGTSLTRNTLNQGGIMNYSSVDTTKATVLATAVRSDGTTFPWALRSGNLTYIGEVPFSYVDESDRAMIFSDLIFDALAPNTATRHRALVRLEDVGPDADPTQLKADADYLYSQHVPFSVAVYPRYVDSKGTYNNGVPESYTLAQRPQVVAALKYMVAKGGTLLMHGYTHQYESANDPYDGVSADDFEFYSAHIDSTNTVVMDGPVANDSANYALARYSSGAADFAAAGLNVPSIFEAPHYAASNTDYQVADSVYSAMYGRVLYSKGDLSNTPIDNSTYIGQFFPYVTKDIDGQTIIPENIGNYEPLPQNNHPAVLVSDLLARSQRNLVVRDGFASFFFHPYYDITALEQIVTGIKAQGYTFVDVNSLYTAPTNPTATFTQKAVAANTTFKANVTPLELLQIAMSPNATVPNSTGSVKVSAAGAPTASEDGYSPLIVKGLSMLKKDAYSAQKPDTPVQASSNSSPKTLFGAFDNSGSKTPDTAWGRFSQPAKTDKILCVQR